MKHNAWIINRTWKRKVYQNIENTVRVWLDKYQFLLLVFVEGACPIAPVDTKKQRGW
jgi:hypothetical protein